MKTSDFHFELPPHLIAQYPPEQRGQSRLMVLNRLTGRREHRMVQDLPEILCGPELRGANGSPPLLVFNDSKVRKARLIGKSLESGALVEFLLIEKMGGRSPPSLRSCASSLPPSAGAPPATPPVWKALVQRAKRRKTGSRYVFETVQAEITGREGEYCLLRFDHDIDDAWLDCYGHIPLPPYIKRQDVPSDAERYQTVYAAATGSAAAPTAGLHFTRDLLDRLAAAGIDSAFVTLHVGLGTFLPVRSAQIENHVMHQETFTVDEECAAKIEAAKAAGRKIIAVGTTSVRTLESAWTNRRLQRGDGETSIFIYPGYKFNVIDALFTNFHTPESTLLMLVAAFAEYAANIAAGAASKSGRELILESYAEAIEKNYRFFSYGDAMLIA